MTAVLWAKREMEEKMGQKAAKGGPRRGQRLVRGVWGRSLCTGSGGAGVASMLGWWAGLRYSCQPWQFCTRRPRPRQRLRQRLCPLRRLCQGSVHAQGHLSQGLLQLQQRGQCQPPTRSLHHHLKRSAPLSALTTSSSPASHFCTISRPHPLNTHHRACCRSWGCGCKHVRCRVCRC